MTYRPNLPPGSSQQPYDVRYQGAAGYMPGAPLPTPPQTQQHMLQSQYAPIQQQQQFFQQPNGHSMQHAHAHAHAQYPNNTQAVAYNGTMNDPRAHAHAHAHGHALPQSQPPMQYAPQPQPQPQSPYPPHAQYAHNQTQYQTHHQQQHAPQHMVSPVPAYAPMPVPQQQQPPLRASPQIHSQPLPQSRPQPQPQPQPQARQSPMPPPTATHSNSPRISTASNSPMLGKKPRISTDGAIQKPTAVPRKASSSSSTKSPRPATKVLVDSPSVLVCAADEFFEKAHAAVQQVAGSMAPDLVAEYQRLIATGLACLQAALNEYPKLAPRAEVMVRLRYGAILGEETENMMEAETSLNMAVQLCEKHRFADLKMYAQFISTKVLFRWKSKAAQIALDGHISDCVTYKNVYWIYALRFLKASFNLHNANPVDAHATDNLKHINNLAKERGDRVIEVMVALLDGITHLKSMRQGALVRVRACIAAASKYQLDDSVKIPQLDILTRLLDLACTLQDKQPAEIASKLSSLQSRIDEVRDSPLWSNNASDMLLPLRKHEVSSRSISDDTKAVLSPGDEEFDHLVLSSFNLVEAYVLAYAMSGLATLYKPGSSEKSLTMWKESLTMLENCGKIPMCRKLSLNEATKHAKWLAGATANIYILMALTAATHSEWAKVKDCMDKLEQLPKQFLTRNLEILILFVRGSYMQGIGELDDALKAFEDPLLKIQDIPGTSDVGRQVEHQAAILAGLNKLWIIQARDNSSTSPELLALVEQLGQICENHVDLEIKTAYNLVIAPLGVDPPLSIKQIKAHIQAGLQGAQKASNTQCLAIALNIMRHCLFENVVGEQAIKSARAGATQAKKSGNLLWMSVAEGMLAESYEVQGLKAEAAKSKEAGTLYANQSYEKTQ